MGGVEAKSLVYTPTRSKNDHKPVFQYHQAIASTTAKFQIPALLLLLFFFFFFVCMQHKVAG